MSNIIDEEDYCKVILLGEMSVGKTCIITQLVRKRFEHTITSTIGASNSSIVLEIGNNHSERFEIWDTSGQERYRSLTKLYYKDASAVIMVYDVTRRRTFTEIQEFWMNEVKQNADEDIIIAIAANKADLYEYEEVDEGEGRKYAQSSGLLFHLTSAKNGEGVENLFREIGKRYLELKRNKKRSKQVKITTEFPDIIERKVSKSKYCC